ncbi:MAG: zinc ribbon domain-containing protein [Deltaproteobacteria bacterium]|nr:zinc ribbon domain-containing protein [Deltaproteobacteria bacterium]
MPTYEYRCLRCKKVFDMVLSIAEHERLKKKRTSKCPKCGSSRVEPQIANFLVQTSKKS